MAAAPVLEKRRNGELTWNYLPVNINPDHLMASFKTHILPLVNWKKEEVEGELSQVSFSDGITNTLIGVYPKGGKKDDMILIRFNGQCTEMIIDREREILTMLSLSSIGLCATVHCQFSNGIAYGFAPGRPITIDEMSDINMCGRIAKTMAALHKVHVPEALSKSGARLSEFFTWFDKIPKQYETEEKNKKLVIDCLLSL